MKKLALIFIVLLAGSIQTAFAFQTARIKPEKEVVLIVIPNISRRNFPAEFLPIRFGIGCKLSLQRV